MPGSVGEFSNQFKKALYPDHSPPNPPKYWNTYYLPIFLIQNFPSRRSSWNIQKVQPAKIGLQLLVLKSGRCQLIGLGVSRPSSSYPLVFTIPKMLRAYFRYDRKLMNDLSRAAHRAVATFMELATREGIRPAMVAVKHTWGEGVRFHPHLHTLVTAGGWNGARTWYPLSAWNEGTLRELFEIEVFRFLRQRELLSRERMEMILSWPHSGFNVHIGEAIAANDKESLTRVARYMLRAPIILSRISYDREQQTVRIGPQNSRGGEPAVLDVLDFVARLTVQIPDPHERLVLYYGPYSNASEAAQGPGR